jgi:iron(III)-salmochelin esterase
MRLSAALALGFAALACRREPSPHSDGVVTRAAAAEAPRAPEPGAATKPQGAPEAGSRGASPPGSFRELTWRYASTPLGPSEVVVAIPEGPPGARWPVLVAFHGRGESLKGPKLGARGWVDDYALGAAARRLSAPPLAKEDLLGFVTGSHLSELNAGLAAHPFRGLIVVCPYLPDVLRGGHGFEDGRALARFVVDDLLPRVYRETPAVGTPASTAVDGVSLGGRASLMVGLLRPEAFGAVGTLQPALDDEEAAQFAELAARARAKNPSLALRLLTSDGDYFLDATRELGGALSARGVAHRLDVVVGPHSYEFNRGPGAYEMLLFHDRALARAAP